MIQFVITFAGLPLYFPMLALTVIFAPLQGFLDALIYIRPRYIQYRNQQAKVTARKQRKRPAQRNVLKSEKPEAIVESSSAHSPDARPEDVLPSKPESSWQVFLKAVSVGARDFDEDELEDMEGTDSNQGTYQLPGDAVNISDDISHMHESRDGSELVDDELSNLPREYVDEGQKEDGHTSS